MGHCERRAVPMRGHEPELARCDVVATAGDDDRAEPVERGLAGGPVREGQARVAGAAAAIRVQRSLVRCGGSLGLGERVRIASEAGRAEEGAIWLLRRVREVTAEAMEEDDGAAFDERERVAPEPQREPEAEVRGEQGVRRLARQVRRRGRDPDEQDVQRGVQLGRAQLDASEQRLRVRDRGRPGKRRGSGQL